MKSLGNNYCNTIFSHIYIEEAVWEHTRTRQILSRFPQAEKILIPHYKDVFCRRKQSAVLQNQFPQLILAAKQQSILEDNQGNHSENNQENDLENNLKNDLENNQRNHSGNLVYQGAAVCQNFGNEHFYYCSCVMNCLYNCEYCYLKGMYPSGNIVIFVNLEDIFAEVENLLSKHPVYLCVSYDSDLMAMEDITGFVRAWMEFAEQHENLRIEVRTKCGRRDLWDAMPPNDRVIFAFTLSPQSIVRAYEHRTANLPERIACAKLALEKGFSVRLCFDPMIYCPDWQTEYRQMLEQISEQIPMEQLYDVSIGSFRISQDYLKKLRKKMKNSAVVQYPFENRNGVYQYPSALAEEMEGLVLEYLRQYLPEDKIFCWKA